MQIIKTSLPKDSLLHKNGSSYSYIDSFQGFITDKENKITPLSILKAFFNSSPKWIEVLFTIRNKIVQVFGLKTPQNSKNKQEIIANLKGKPNEQIGLFKIFETTNNEIIMGEDDKHLNFRVSLLMNQSEFEPTKKNITVSTTVHFNNWFGKLYFLPVKPFHNKIVPAILKSILTELEKTDNN
ncbi:DUF2867 domain-containing protein [Flavobacterium sp. HNIBRBA15423]|uniref:DUF2867 domain-containing protein n=1 Tax=Flavobacterium sp. HNIBRBA15423 TaxID=3458683 RepID=UPI004043F945